MHIFYKKVRYLKRALTDEDKINIQFKNNIEEIKLKDLYDFKID